jgi:purine nucleoside phosphorylase
MARLAVIGGHSFLGTEPLAGLESRRVETSHGEVELMAGSDRVLLQRHGLSRYRPAVAIDHRANLLALRELGCERIVALGSVGSLHSDLAVGTAVVPDDFIALHLGLSVAPGRGGERVPGFDRAWRERVLAAWRAHDDGPVTAAGTYWQAIGPRFETPAEIAFIAPHADVIGMTIAAECILAGELGIPYAAVCMVDNLANGIADEPLSVEEFEAGKARNRDRLLAVLEPLVDELATTVAGR